MEERKIVEPSRRLGSLSGFYSFDDLVREQSVVVQSRVVIEPSREPRVAIVFTIAETREVAGTKRGTHVRSQAVWMIKADHDIEPSY